MTVAGPAAKVRTTSGGVAPEAASQTVNDLEPLGFHWKSHPAWCDRGLAVGGVGTGKSTVCEALIQEALDRVPDLRVLILDSKPRFRAEFQSNGLLARIRYRKWDHGTFIGDSIALSGKHMDKALKDVWRQGARVAIAQSLRGAIDVPELGELLRAAESFYNEARASEPRLLYADELMDFFSVGGHPVARNPALLRVHKNGRERGLSGLYATQRTKGIPRIFPQEANKLFLFQLRNEEDVENLADFGNPGVLLEKVPTQNHVFWFYDHEDDGTEGYYRLNVMNARQDPRRPASSSVPGKAGSYFKLRGGAT